MKVQILLVVVWTWIELPLLISSFAVSNGMYQSLDDSSMFSIAYNRSTEVEKHCSSFLTSANELKPDDNRGSRLKNELSFYLGDWWQENDEAPLMQLLENSHQLLKLVSFEVKDVNSVQQLKNTVSVGGILSLGISKDTSFLTGTDPRMTPGSSVAKIVFEGVYMETEENGGERLMCLLGSSTSTPDMCECNDQFSSEFPSDYPFNQGNYQRPRLHFLEDDQILLVLRYPKTFSLTKRAIHGEMMSLNKQGTGSRYFSKVYMSSQLSGLSKYQFTSELLQYSRATDPSPYQDELNEDGVHMFTAGEFCQVLQYDTGEVLDIVMNYKFGSGRYVSQVNGKLGPFLLGKDMVLGANGGELSSDDIKLIFQHVKCEQDTANSNRTGNAKVSAVLRAVPLGSFRHFHGIRTGVSGLTLAVEGIWNSSSGQLFMVGCRQGTVTSGLEGCDYEVSMYFPRSFSIKQRSLMFGSISSLKEDIGLDNPLFFSAVTRSRDLDHVSYNYTKIDAVNAFEKRSTLAHQLSTIVKQLIFWYPALQDGEEEPVSQLRLLSNSLALDGYVVSDQLNDQGHNSKVFFQVEVIALGSLFSRARNQWKKPVITKDEGTSNRFLNVPMHLVFEDEKDHKPATYNNVSELSLEGVYDPVSGEMHSIGCRRALVHSTGLERGQDCLIEVRIQYPPKNFQWWRKPFAKITISSQRAEDDPLHFSSITLHAILHHYLNDVETLANRECFDGILCILMLAGSVAIIWSQLRYMKVNADIVPYISTSMLAFQALGYSLPLICGAKVLLKSKESEAYRAGHHPAIGMLKVIQSLENVFLLVALLLTSRLFQMVTESRSRQQNWKKWKRSSSKLRHACIIATYTIGIGTLIWFAAGDHNPEQHMHPPRKHINMQQWIWMSATEEFVYLLQDLFLLPQIVSNYYDHRLKPTPAKSLREAYYLGFTCVRLLVHLFDYIKEPILNPTWERYQFTMSPESSPTFFANVAAPTPTAIVFAATIVYIQQNWKYPQIRR